MVTAGVWGNWQTRVHSIGFQVVFLIYYYIIHSVPGAQCGGHGVVYSAEKKVHESETGHHVLLRARSKVTGGQATDICARIFVVAPYVASLQQLTCTAKRLYSSNLAHNVFPQYICHFPIFCFHAQHSRNIFVRYYCFGYQFISVVRVVTNAKRWTGGCRSFSWHFNHLGKEIKLCCDWL